MSDLFAERRQKKLDAAAPLALRMRPRTLDEFAGQQHILGPGKLLRRMLDADVITSLILHGPPGTGKTTLAELIAKSSRRLFVRENAASVGVKRIREIIDEGARRLADDGPRTILFLDEIHRFTRAQQDVLLGDVERGVITLIGATTENPLFACNAALVSRSTLFRLEPLSEDDIIAVLKRAIADTDRGFGARQLTVTDDALKVWAIKSDGDARRALTALEVAVLSGGRRPGGTALRAVSPAGSASERAQVAGGERSGQEDTARRAMPPPITIDQQAAEDSIQQKATVYDMTGDQHYDAASALIKSLRGSDPDAALYWLAYMIEGGEDPRFIARRMAILASEDIGNADPRAIMVAQAAWNLVERIGMPEARITLAQCATYLAMAPKSNASYLAIDEALADVREGRTLPVPLYLRDSNTSPVASEGGKGVRVRQSGGESYEYSHAAPDALSGQDYLGVEKAYYRPAGAGIEKAFAEKLAEVRRRRRERYGPAEVEPKPSDPAHNAPTSTPDSPSESNANAP